MTAPIDEARTLRDALKLLEAENIALREEIERLKAERDALRLKCSIADGSHDLARAKWQASNPNPSAEFVLRRREEGE